MTYDSHYSHIVQYKKKLEAIFVKNELSCKSEVTFQMCLTKEIIFTVWW